MFTAPDAPLQMYIENIRNRDPAYLITESGVRDALHGLDLPLTIVERYADDPDLDALSRSGFLIGSAFDTERVRQHGHALKLIHSTSAGVERLFPLTWLPGSAVLTNSSGVHADKAGEFGLLALLMLNDHIPQHATSQKQHTWRRTLSTPIRGKTVLIYGVGALGGAVADRARLLGLTIWGIRRSGQPHASVDHMFRPSDLPGLLGEVDFLVVTSPLTADTRGAIGAEEIRRMKPGAGLVNMARAAVVDYEALAIALKENRLSGAVLDVFEQEPLPADAPWWEVPNLSVIPHVSSDSSVDYVKKSLTIFRSNLENLLSEKPLVNVVDAGNGY
jgi:glyoxylate/hydroxypyruvate reductase A